MAKAEKKISSAFIYFFGSFGGILFGYDIGVMTGALPFLQADWHLENAASLVGWITSAVMFGAIFGGALAGQLSDKFGRRKMILMSAIVFMVFSVLSGVSPDMGEASAYYLIIVRMLLGLAVGAASALVPAYMSEMAPAKARGRLSGLNQTMIVSGMLLSYVVDFLLKDLPGEWAWRLMLGLAAVPALILFLGVLRLPESPRFLLRKGDEAQARKVLSYIRKNPAEIDQELASIKETAKEERQANQKTSWSTLFSGKYRYLVIAGVGVAAFQQFQGANAIFYYIPLIVQKATELGADKIVFFDAARSISHWQGNKQKRKIERLQKIAESAAEQSHRNKIPQVEYSANLDQLLANYPATKRIVAWEESAKQGEASVLAQQFNALKPGDSVLAVFGPEGGLTENEIAKMNEAGMIAAGLGPRILRTETAPLYFMAAISYAMELS